MALEPTGGKVPEGLFGLMAEFTEPEALIQAIQRTREAGYERFDAHSPWLAPGLTEALGPPRDSTKIGAVSILTMIGALTGAATGFGMQWFAAAWDYPINVAERPLFSWPAFIPITFELTVLFGGLTAAFSMLALNGLPRLHHPVFSHPPFLRASKDRFFLCIEARDERFDRAATRAFLETLGALDVAEVSHDDDAEIPERETPHAS